MTRKKKNDAKAPDAATPTWTKAELLAVKGIGPGIIGQEMFDAAQRVFEETGGGTLGPAIIFDTPEEAEAHGARHLLPVKPTDGKAEGAESDAELDEIPPAA